MILLGIALILLGGAVLLAMRHSLWPWREPGTRPEPPAPAPFGQRIYVPSERGTVYVSDAYADGPDDRR